jgi:hypothetical protein
LKSYSRPFLGITPPVSSKQISVHSEPGTLSAGQELLNGDGHFPALVKEEEELIEQDIRDRFRHMCEGYFENVCKKLLIEHKVSIVSISHKTNPYKFVLHRGFKIKINVITKHTFALVKFLRIVNKDMRR